MLRSLNLFVLCALLISCISMSDITGEETIMSQNDPHYYSSEDDLYSCSFELNPSPDENTQAIQNKQ